MRIRGLVSLVLFLLFLPFIILGGREIVTLLTEAAPVPADIKIDFAKSQGKLSRPWEGISQGGEQDTPGKLVSLAPVSNELSSLGVKYVRIDHVLNQPFDSSYKERIGEIVSVGATPIIALSYFPREVADTDTGTPKDWSVWQSRVRALVEEVSGKNSLNLKGVYYEVWNEPDGPTFGDFDIGEGKDYFLLYQKTAVAVESAENTNEFKLGGPALADLRRCTTGLLFTCQTFWLDRFFGLVSKNRTRLDFVSWHRYSLRISDYEEDVNFILKSLNKYPNLKTPETLLTEWGSDPARSPIHNTTFDAAHLVAAARTFIGHIDIATKFEARDGPDSGDSGWGILKYSGEKKPTFVALDLLSRLKDNRIPVSGEGTFVKGIASSDGSTYSVVLVNFDKASSHTEIVPIRFSNLPVGRNRLTRTILNEQNPTGKVTTTSFRASRNYSFKETLLPNTVVLYEIERLAGSEE